MASSGCAWTQTGSIWLTGVGVGRAHASLKKVVWLGDWKDRDSQARSRAAEGGRQSAQQASSKNFGREGADSGLG